MKLHSAMTGLMFSAAALLTPVVVQAQFTTFVAPPRKAVDSTKPATVAQAKAKSDSITRMSITSMKEWVDSVAGTSTQVATASDTTMSNPAATTDASTSSATAPNANARATTTTFSNGAIAPNTASPLPLYLATGFASLAAGLLLLTRLRRRPAEAVK